MDIIFKSDNLDFVNVSVDYVYDYLDMINDSSIQEFVYTENRVFDYDGEIEWINSKLESGACNYSIVERKSGKFVGNVGFENVSGSSAELGICITSIFQDKHYGTEAIKKIIEYGFNELGFDEIYLRVFSHNARAIHCYKKIGFIEYDVIKDVKKSNGAHVDEILMKVKKMNYFE